MCLNTYHFLNILVIVPFFFFGSIHQPLALVSCHVLAEILLIDWKRPTYTFVACRNLQVRLAKGTKSYNTAATLSLPVSSTQPMTLSAKGRDLPEEQSLTLFYISSLFRTHITIQGKCTISLLSGSIQGEVALGFPRSWPKLGVSEVTSSPREKSRVCAHKSLRSTSFQLPTILGG